MKDSVHFQGSQCKIGIDMLQSVWWRATKVIRSLEHRTKRDWENCACSAKKNRLMGDLIAAFRYLLAKCNQDGNNLLRVPG